MQAILLALILAYWRLLALICIEFAFRLYLPPIASAALAVHIVENGYINGETIRIDGALRMQPK